MSVILNAGIKISLKNVPTTRDVRLRKQFDSPESDGLHASPLWGKWMSLLLGLVVLLLAGCDDFGLLSVLEGDQSGLDNSAATTTTSPSTLYINPSAVYVTVNRSQTFYASGGHF